ncbi:ribose 5-phosphate isomerase B [Pacificimonas flava]|uniref:Ribose 5-phosphate isomerase B n=2 Tax=Pacificimonas TaxID=1960290 RepID=A0A219B6R1_9SPHN|nr:MULTISPECIES: ribose 5-phosphate isomerase B [Pacificimonas]MBZ6378947.1 ribose 5-phosphate isomerase B [Pacificimonas aurantium]OWV33806.1 ribose 5-phosphate isomerase B [Pacificimonas flava]
MTQRKIAIASDHAGFVLKSKVKSWLEEAGHQVIDLGTDSAESVDWSDYGRKLGETVAADAEMLGVAICGSGIGIAIAANKVKGARAATCMNGLMARLTRAHNDANILSLGERLIGDEVAKDCLHQFLTTEFEGGRHQRRVDKLESD